METREITKTLAEEILDIKDNDINKIASKIEMFYSLYNPANEINIITDNLKENTTKRRRLKHNVNDLKQEVLSLKKSHEQKGLIDSEFKNKVVFLNKKRTELEILDIDVKKLELELKFRHYEYNKSNDRLLLELLKAFLKKNMKKEDYDTLVNDFHITNKLIFNK